MNTEMETSSEKAPEYTDQPPPSYESLFGKIKQAKQNSGGNVAFAQNVVGITTNSFGYIIFLVLVLAIPITCIVIGSSFLHQCPAQRYIPIYLIVFGVFTLIRDVSSLIQTFKARKDGIDENQQQKPNPFDGLLSCFLFAWFICGNVWIYQTYGNFTTSNPAASDYCHHTLFYFSFWLLNVTYIILGVMCFCGCVCCAYICCMIKGAD